MDDARIGRALRALRRRRGLRQSEVAVAAGVSQSTVSDVESGRVARLPMATIRRIFAAVDAGFEGTVLWRGAGLDRLLDARHAALVAASVRRLGGLGWETRVETTYSVFGERGSIDVMGAFVAMRAVLVEEVKSEIASLEETLRKLDEKVRLARERIAEREFGWRPESVGRVLVLPDSTTSRRRVLALDPVLRVAFPDRGSAVRVWLRSPSGDLSGILFQPDIVTGDRSQTDVASSASGAAEKAISGPDIAPRDVRCPFGETTPRQSPIPEPKIAGADIRRSWLGPMGVTGRRGQLHPGADGARRPVDPPPPRPDV